MAEDFERALGGTPPGGTRVTEHCQGIGEVNAVYYSPSPFEAPQPKRNLIRQMRLVKSAFSYMGKKGIKVLFRIAPKREFRHLKE